jgi:hypothetical protein
MEKYLVPTDAILDDLRSTAIPMEAVQKFFSWLESSQVLFFIDSCYSGVASGRTFERPDYQPRAALTDEFLDHLSGEGRLVVTACDVNEVSLEAADLGHGLFTYYLMEGLKGKGDLNGDGLVTVQELYEYVHENVSQRARKLNGSMHPIQKGSLRGRVVLTRYETETQRQARTLRAEAEGRERAGELVRALALWIRVTQLDPADQPARQWVEEIRRRLEDEERVRQERRGRIETTLYSLYRGGELPKDEYIVAMGAVSKQPETLTDLEGEVRHFVELLTDGEISTPLYIASIKQARKQRASPGGDPKAPGGRAPTPPQIRADAPAPTASPTESSPVPPPAPVAQTSPDQVDSSKVGEGKGLVSPLKKVGGGTALAGAVQQVERTTSPGTVRLPEYKLGRLSVSIGLLGGIATIVYVKLGLPIWAGFIAWACFFHSGGDGNALKNTIVGNAFGAFWAWVAALIILSFPMADYLGLPVWVGIVVGITVLVLCLAAHINAFSSIPASVYGYAAIFAFLLQTADSMTKEKLMSASLANALVCVTLSMAIGAVFGIASSKLGGALTAAAA